MKRDRFGHTMNCEIAKNIAALRTSSLYAPALEGHLRKFFHVKKFRTAQMIVAFFDARIDALHIDLRSDRGILRMFAIDFDPAAEVRELAASRAEELMNTKPDAGARRIEFVVFLRCGGEAEPGDYERRDNIAESHFDVFFAPAASVFKSGVRESGNRPNKFPSANAGSAFNR